MDDQFYTFEIQDVHNILSNPLPSLVWSCSEGIKNRLNLNFNINLNFIGFVFKISLEYSIK